MLVRGIGSCTARLAGSIEAARELGVSYFSSTIMFDHYAPQPGFGVSVLGVLEGGDGQM